VGDEPRKLIAIRLDAKVLSWLRKTAEKKGLPYQSLVNEILAGAATNLVHLVNSVPRDVQTQNNLPAWKTVRFARLRDSGRDKSVHPELGALAEASRYAISMQLIRQEKCSRHLFSPSADRLRAVYGRAAQDHR
jgi:hypothetical protein